MNARARGVYARLAIAIALAFAITPVAAWLLPNTRWHRVATRTFLITLIILFTASAGHPRTWTVRLRAMGLRGPHRLSRVAFGFGLAVLLFAGLLGFSYLWGARGVSHEVLKHSLIKHIGLAMLTGVLVSLVEEPLCRGFLKDTVGGVASAFLYSIAHLFRPMHKTAPADGFEPLIVFNRFPDMLEGWTVTRQWTWGVLSIFILGLALNRLRDRTGSLYAGIGIHMGLVFGMKIYSRWVSPHPNGSDMIWGWNRLHDGLVGTIVMGLLLWAVYRMPLPPKLLDGTNQKA